jgi:hypothetical protein
MHHKTEVAVDEDVGVEQGKVVEVGAVDSGLGVVG